MSGKSAYVNGSKITGKSLNRNAVGVNGGTSMGGNIPTIPAFHSSMLYNRYLIDRMALCLNVPYGLYDTDNRFVFIYSSEHIALNYCCGTFSTFRGITNINPGINFEMVPEGLKVLQSGRYHIFVRGLATSRTIYHIIKRNNSDIIRASSDNNNQATDATLDIDLSLNDVLSLLTEGNGIGQFAFEIYLI